MEKRHLGTSDIQISPIVMGTWQAGKKMWVGIEDSDTIKAIREAFDAGITTVDTAEVYGEGHSEQIVAQALSDVRDQAVYATKVFANHLKYDQVIEACDRSLKNLKTDYIDLYQIHWPSGVFKSEIVPIEETMSALNHLKEQGKIRAIGVSNFSRAQLEEAAQYGRIDSLQPPYSLFWRWVEKDAMPYCVENKISILAYSSLAQGLLTGKFGSDHQFDPA
ncbi:aldo/keto reductase, partial [Coleofasciculus sp. FACHB-712]|uniref:aldo/keto reductase n=1 Tax=Coleofasciculus sp. FACHB-712 TaxID=2692789 RepID=UPI001685EBA6